MRFSLLLGLIAAASLSTFVKAQEGGPDGPPPGPPPGEGGPPPGEGGPPPPGAEGGPPPPGEGGPPPPGAEGGPPPGPPPEAFAAGGPPGANDQGPPGGGIGPYTKRPVRKWTPGELIFIRGPKGCYVRPFCKSERINSHYQRNRGGQLVVCKKPATKPDATKTRYVWKAQPCVSADGRSKHYVRFENQKYKGKFLCLTKTAHNWTRRKWTARFAILTARTHGGCRWKAKQVWVYSRRQRKLRRRYVLINKKFKKYILRKRRKCGKRKTPRPLFGAQNYIPEARADPYGAFKIIPVTAGAKAGYAT